MSERAKPPLVLAAAEFEDDAIVVTSRSGTTRAVIRVEGGHRCVDRDNCGHIVPMKNPMEPVATTVIETVS